MNFRQNSLRLLALVVCFSLARGAHASTLTAFGVDSSLGGQMTITSGTISQIDGTITITASDPIASTASYQNVGFAIAFFYPADSSGAVNGNGYIYQGGGIWQNAGDTQQLNITTVNAPFSSIMQMLNPAQILVPLTDTNNGFSAGPLLPTDSIPLVELGNFTPGTSKTFVVNYTQPQGAPFKYASDSFFVASVPEPSSMSLAVIGCAALLLAARRRLLG